MNILSSLVYWLLIYPLSLLPFSILYGISDILFLIIFRLAGYRKKVVYQNLKNSFPEKTEREIHVLAKKFYHHFCDLMVESFKLFSIDEKTLAKRIRFTNPALLNHYFDQGKSVILAGGHYNNWEVFAVAIQRNIKHQAVALYKPLANQWFDRKMRSNRGRYGMQMVPIQNAKDFFLSAHPKPTATIFGMDQSPSRVRKSHWMTFLNQDTAVTFGTEAYARKTGQPVIFGRILKRKRGFYEVEFEVVSENHEALSQGMIVEKVMRILEKDIQKEPEWWLWSHRRWKRKKPEDLVISGEAPVQ
ncbi:MAG: lysophospholipid acyltransferase family protein [Bacteroidetes bacterium]|nr:lysophospholipid acyltransferase family protein [Bacteroidota bacterium]